MHQWQPAVRARDVVREVTGIVRRNALPFLAGSLVGLLAGLAVAALTQTVVVLEDED
jgi:hypothetical protein